MAVKLRIGADPDFDKAVLVAMLETLAKTSRPMTSPKILEALNGNEPLLARLQAVADRSIFPIVQPTNYVGNILKFAMSKGWITDNIVQNKSVQSIRLGFRDIFIYSINPIGESGIAG